MHMARQAAPQPAGESESVLALRVEIEALRQAVRELKLELRAERDAASAVQCAQCGASS
jgi:hypothetical protein